MDTLPQKKFGLDIKKAYLVDINGIKTSLNNKKSILNHPVLITSGNEINHFKLQSFLGSNTKIKVKKVSSSLKFCSRKKRSHLS